MDLGSCVFFGGWILDLGSCVFFRVWILEFGSWSSDLGFWILDFGGFWLNMLGDFLVKEQRVLNGFPLDVKAEGL